MYNTDERALIWLNSFNVSIRKKNELINNFMSPSEMFDEFIECKDIVVSVLGEKHYSIMSNVAESSYIDKLINAFELKGISAITSFSDDYPQRLSDTLGEEAPIVLYYVGDLDLLDTRSIAVIGTRKVTRYGRDVTEKFSRELSLHNFTIISGLARGVDSIAHKECLKNDGKTIAVLGCGLDIVYPRENLELYRDIAEKGLIISEFPVGTDPHPYNFPQRNRIIVTLADGVLVTEASEKSGTMISANYAIEYGKDLFAVPGNIFSEQSIGTNLLIKKSDRVVMTTGVNDILEKYDIKPREQVVEPIQLDFIEQSIINELADGKLHFEEILAKTSIEVSALITTLTGLEVSKIIRKLPGNFYELRPN